MNAETLWVHPAWVWQPGERTSFTIHYDALQGGRRVYTGCCIAWAFDADEAFTLATAAAGTQGLLLANVEVAEDTPLVFDAEAGEYRPRARYQVGWPLVDL